MELTKAYKFRIYPDTKRQEEIDERLILAQQFYNKILEKSIMAYQNGKTKTSIVQFNRFVKETIQEDKRFLKLYSQTRCEIEYRLLKAYQNFFRRIKEGNRKAGFPRFKSRDRYKSITYPQDNGSFKIEREKKRDRLRVSRIGTMKIELHRSIEGKIKTMAIKKEAGKYHAIFTAIKEAEVPKIKDINPVGIDVGLKTFAVLSDGTRMEKPRFARKKERKLARWQRIVARRTTKEGRKKAILQSHNRGRAIEKLGRTWQEVNNQTNDYLQKITTKLVNLGYTSFAMEKLQIQNMMKDHKVARSISGASWSKFKELLSYKAESAGMEVYEVNPTDTSRTCSNCGNIQEMPLSERTFLCIKCGMQKDRDYNASINILKRATAGHAGRNASGDATSTIQLVSQVASVNQEHTLHLLGAGEAHTL